jgi:hypothetical protein
MAVAVMSAPQAASHPPQAAASGDQTGAEAEGRPVGAASWAAFRVATGGTERRVVEILPCCWAAARAATGGAECRVVEILPCCRAVDSSCSNVLACGTGHRGLAPGTAARSRRPAC